MTRYLLANLIGGLALVVGYVGAAACLYELAGWTGIVLVVCLVLIRDGRRFATLAAPLDATGSYSYEVDAR